MSMKYKKNCWQACWKVLGLFLISVGGAALAAESGYGIQSSPDIAAVATSQQDSNVPTNTEEQAPRNQAQNQERIDALLKNQTTAAPSVPTVAVSNSGLSDEAFANTVRNAMPLSTEQIRTLRYLFDQSQRAASAAPIAPPKPTSSAIIVNLSPGATPPLIRLTAGFVTSLVFVDSTGAPWPIQAFDLGDPQSFNVQWDKKGSTLMVQALRHYVQGNLAVMLKDLDTPIMLTLLPGQDAVDYRVDLRVPGLGPNANLVLDGLPGVESPGLLNVLNGIPPANSQTVHIAGGDCDGWIVKDDKSKVERLYLRTRLTILSPGWLSTMSSPDGTHAYELMKTPMLLASQHGKLIKLRVEGL